jgi:hypothetical protein
VQTSLDGGATWVDIAEFSFGTASESYIVNLSAETPHTTYVTPTDGAMGGQHRDQWNFGAAISVLFASRQAITRTPR